MSHVFEMTEEEYQVIAEAAQAQGKAPDALFRDWVESVRQHLDGEARDPDQTWFWTPAFSCGIRTSCFSHDRSELIRSVASRFRSMRAARLRDTPADLI